LDRDDELQEPENEEGLGDASHEGEAEPESDQGASTYQLTPQRPEQHFYFMTPQTHRSNSLADRVRGRQSTGGAAWASLVKPWIAADDPVPAADQNTPRATAELKERRISQLERRVGPIPSLRSFWPYVYVYFSFAGYSGTKALRTHST
jgi:hypothetical protein